MAESSRGMTQMSTLAGSLIAFACAPGTTASDVASNRRNGVFTSHLLQHIMKPGEHILMSMIDVAKGVAYETNNKQIPYTTHCLQSRDVYLVPPIIPKPNQNHGHMQNAALPNIPHNARWVQKGVTVAGGHGEGSASNQLHYPRGLHVDEDQTVIIADRENHRIVEWKRDDTSGRVVAGGNGKGSRTDQLNNPSDVIVDKMRNSLIICDSDNRRVMQWSRRSGAIRGEMVVGNINCGGLTLDDQRFLYVSDCEKNEVRRYRMGEKTNGTVVAGGNGTGDGLNQLNCPTYVFVDREYSVYVSDYNNHRVMKWVKGAKEGIVVAGGQGGGNELTQLSHPKGVFVGSLGTVYEVDWLNHRVMRWHQGATQGTVVVDGRGERNEANQLYYPQGLSFDRQGNLYVSDWGNARVQRFLIATS